MRKSSCAESRSRQLPWAGFTFEGVPDRAMESLSYWPVPKTWYPRSGPLMTRHRYTSLASSISMLRQAKRDVLRKLGAKALPYYWKGRITEMSLTQENRSRILESTKKLVLKHHINSAGVDCDAWVRLVDERAPELLTAEKDVFESGVRVLLSELRSSHTAFIMKGRTGSCRSTRSTPRFRL
jgi:hypothetical protein